MFVNMNGTVTHRGNVELTTQLRTTQTQSLHESPCVFSIRHESPCVLSFTSQVTVCALDTSLCVLSLRHKSPCVLLSLCVLSLRHKSPCVLFTSQVTVCALVTPQVTVCSVVKWSDFNKHKTQMFARTPNSQQGCLLKKHPSH